MTSKKRAQIGMEDRVVSNSELLTLLEERETLKEGAKAFRAKDKHTKDTIKGLDEPMPYRVGRFLIDKTERPARSVSFETNASVGIKISRADQDD